MKIEFKVVDPYYRGGYIDTWPEANESGQLEKYRDQESEYFWRTGCDTEVVFTENTDYPDCIDELYYDHAPHNSQFLDRTFFSAYTPTGLKHHERWIHKQIINGSLYSDEELRTMIEKNIHFHDCIKTNLIYNLEQYRK